MQFTEARMGRIFIIRLHDGDHLPDVLENFAKEQNVKSAICFLVGGAKENSRVVVGPKDGNAPKIEPMSIFLKGVHETAGVGTIFENEEGEPKLHMHASFGRNDEAKTGCVRLGVDIWLIGEVILMELIGTDARRVVDEETGFEILEVNR